MTLEPEPRGQTEDDERNERDRDEREPAKRSQTQSHASFQEHGAGRYDADRGIHRLLEDSILMNSISQDAGAPNNRFLAMLGSHGDFPLVLAHRGDSFRAPENTIEAARLGWQDGADAWELDVQLTRDGVPVVLHDESLLRTTDVATKFAGDVRARDGFRLSDFDFVEVRALDAGSWFVNPAGGPRSATRLAAWAVSTSRPSSITRRERL